MKLTTIEARDLPDAWSQCLREALDNGIRYLITRGSYAGQYRSEIDFVTIRVKYPGSRPLVPDVPQYIEDYLPYLMTSKRKENEEYTYGEYLEPQIQKVIRMYKEGGYGTNQACMAVGDCEKAVKALTSRKKGKLHGHVEGKW